MSADAASWLAPASPSIKKLDPSTARTAGLLHSLGLLWLFDKLPNELDEAFEITNRDQEQSLRQVLNRILGFDHAQAGECLGRNWGFPDTLVAAMAHYPETNYQGDHSEIVHTVGLAVKLVSVAWKAEPCPSPDIRSQSLGINQKSLGEIFDRIYQRQLKIRDLAKNLFA